MSQSAIYVIQAEHDHLLRNLEERFRVKRQRRQTQTRLYYDTFDWRLYRAGASAYTTTDEIGIRLHWATREEGPAQRQLVLKEPPSFASQLPPGPFRDFISPLIQMRRLLPVVQLTQRVQMLHILGVEDKTIAHVALVDAAVRGPDENRPLKSLPRMLRAGTVRGYEKAYARVVNLLEAELGLQQEPTSLLDVAARAAGLTPGEYSSKLQIELDPAMRTVDALVVIQRTLLDTILSNEDGTRRDLDPEFLHDFRVAVRRTRAALSQIKSVFARENADHFLGEFSWLGRLTGTTRDLDVYILKMRDYEASLPEEFFDSLKPLAEFLRANQRIEQKRLAEALGSERYQTLINQWKAFLHSPIPPAQVLPRGEEPIIQVASRRIWRVYKRILRNGKAITDESPAADLHSLRIECKKLRYLMEFFRSLYDPGEMAELIKYLRILQDNLGDFNDCEIQQTTLAYFAQRMYDEKGAGVQTLMALGRLVERLEIRQRQERHRFSKRFSAFASPRNKKKFQKLFSRKRGKL